MKHLWVSSIVFLSLGAGCGSSKTVDQIGGFADEVCACTDAACATAVQVKYLGWWKKNQRARGSEGDRKDVEKAMERYAQCHLKLVGPEPTEEPPEVPKVDLVPSVAPVSDAGSAAAPLPEGAAKPEAESGEKPAKAAPEASGKPAKVEPEARSAVPANP